MQLQSDDYDILQNLQSFTLRHYFADLQSDSDSDNDNDNDTFISIISTFTLVSRVYESFFEFSSLFETLSFKVIKQQKKKNIISFSLHLALSLYFERIERSRAKYVKLRKIFQLFLRSRKSFSTSTKEEMKIDFISTLLLKLNSLKRQIYRHISMLQLMRKTLSIIIEKQLSLVARQKNQRQRQRIERLSWQYWYDSIDLVRNILSAEKLCEKMHFDMTTYVNESTKLWNSQVWDLSIRNVFDDVCYIESDDLMIFEDIVHITIESFKVEIYTMIRVTFIDKDHRSETLHVDEIIVTEQAIIDDEHLILRDFQFVREAEELFILENIELKVSLNQMNYHISVFLDRQYDDEDDLKSFMTKNFFIARVINTSSIVRSLRRLNSTRDELKVAYFDR